MTVFVQKFKDGNRNKFEVFRRSTAPEDSSIAVEDTRQAAIARAGQVAGQNESIREMADQSDFDVIREGDVAPGPGRNPAGDPAGGFFDGEGGFQPARNENQQPLGRVDDELDSLLGAPNSGDSETESFSEALDGLLGSGRQSAGDGGGDDDDGASAGETDVIDEDDVQASNPVSAGLNTLFGAPDSDEKGAVQRARDNPRELAEEAADRFFVNR